MEAADESSATEVKGAWIRQAGFPIRSGNDCLGFGAVPQIVSFSNRGTNIVQLVADESLEPPFKPIME